MTEKEKDWHNRIDAVKSQLEEQTKLVEEFIKDLDERPFKCVGFAETFNLETHKEAGVEIQDALSNQERIYVKVQKEGHRFWLIVIGQKEDAESFNEGFFGIIDTLLPDDLSVKFNDLIGFNPCDVIEIRK